MTPWDRAWHIVTRQNIVEHEAAHTAMLLICGIIPERVEVKTTVGRVAGFVTLAKADRSLSDPKRAAMLAIATLAGPMTSGVEPSWPLVGDQSSDEDMLLKIARRLRLDRKGYCALTTLTAKTMAGPAFGRLSFIYEAALECDDVLDAEHIGLLLEIYQPDTREIAA